MNKFSHNRSVIICDAQKISKVEEKYYIFLQY